MKGSNLNPALCTRLKENTVAYGGIHYLDVANVNIGPKEMTVLGDLMRSNGTSSGDGCPIISIDFSNNPICGLNSRGKGTYDSDGLGDFCTSWITLGNKNNSRLRKLNFSRCLLQTKGFSLLSNLLTVGPSSLQELILRDCGGNSESMEKLCDGIRGSRALTSLDISENKIGAAGGNALASALSSSPKLKQLLMNSCEVGPDGMQSIFLSLQSNGGLEVFSCCDNNFADAACEALATMLRSNQRIKNMDISENGITHDGVIALCKGIAKNRTLTVLGLQWNDLTNESARCIGEAMNVNNTLKAIHVLGTHIDIEGIQAIVNGSMVSSDRPVDLDLGFCYRPASRAKQRERKVLKEESTIEEESVPPSSDAHPTEESKTAASATGR